jgi:DNA-binding transcriptional ArsR family regulator
MILCLLAEGPRPVTAIAGALELSQPYVSQQLARLRGDGLVRAEREGRAVTYALADDRVRPVVMAIHAAFCPTGD